MNTTAIANTLSGIYRLLGVAFALFVLYFAQTLVIPVTVAALLTFLLSPLVTYLEKWVGRLVSILISVLVVFSIIGLIGYMFGKQLIDFGAEFQNYAHLIQAKFKGLYSSGEVLFDHISASLNTLKGGILGSHSQPEAGARLASPFDVKLIDLSSHISSFVETIVGSLFSLLSMAGIILLLVIFMLYHREDIRSRIIKLMGQKRISSTTSAMKDASERVTSYLFRFLMVNTIFGFAVFVGLSIIGIPNAVLWGFLAGILRFIPYIGAWIAALIPIALSFIITDSWMTPIYTILLFAGLEAITAYGLEPLYYGGGTGVSPFALILAALFWTWLWGPIGLVLSTPLTVCLVVLGQNVTNMSFLRVLLSQEQPLTPAEEFYHRLLLKDSSEAIDLTENYIQKNSLPALHEEVILPTILQTEKDFRFDLIDAEKKGEVYQDLREILDSIELTEQKKEEAAQAPIKVLCLPAHTLRDELGATLIAQTLISNSFSAEHTNKLSLPEILSLIEKESPQIVALVAVPPLVLTHTRLLAAKISQQKPKLPLLICLLGSPDLDPAALEKLTASGATHVAYTLAQVLKTAEEETKANHSN